MVPKPEIRLSAGDETDVISGFLNACSRNGSEIIQVYSQEEAREEWRKIQAISQGGTIANSGKQTTNNVSKHTIIVESMLGVAENGAVWLAENNLESRLAPFSCEHLVVILYEKDVVATLHEAYIKVDIISGERGSGTKYGFGVFIAGPSKTADIEQTLVVGAQGSKKHTIIFVNS